MNSAQGIRHFFFGDLSQSEKLSDFKLPLLTTDFFHTSAISRDVFLPFVIDLLLIAIYLTKVYTYLHIIITEMEKDFEPIVQNAFVGGLLQNLTP